MMKGPKVFTKITTYLKTSLGTDPFRVATEDDIEEVCILYGELYILLYYSFSFIYNIKNRIASIGEVCVLKKRLESVRLKWLTIGLICC